MQTIKKLQQRISDLKKTLQRELNVQSLPNDDVTDDAHLRKNGVSPAQLSTNGYGAYAGSSGDEREPRVTRASANAPAMLPVPSSTMLSALPSNRAHPQPSRGRTDAGDRLEYDRDINFDYLRHVVLKFMLSRESEALHLIKAVAVLLDFTQDEQRLLRDTLEYKMSWFGARPKFGEGQFSKYVPP